MVPMYHGNNDNGKVVSVDEDVDRYAFCNRIEFRGLGEHGA
jgi:hypothetical protein